MKKLFVLLVLVTFAGVFSFHGCDSDQSTNVILNGEDGDGNSGTTIVDTVYIDDSVPCDPDTVYLNDSPPCVPDTVVVNDCPSCDDDSPYEGFFQIMGMSAANVTESCQYSWIVTTVQTVDIRGDYINFAGWLVDWDSASNTGSHEWNDYYEIDGIFYDMTMRFEISFSNTDNLTAILTYHTEAGYVGYAVSYTCDDQFTLVAERITESQAAENSSVFSRKKLPVKFME